MNIFARIRLGLFGKNNPSNFQQMFKKHLYDSSVFSYAEDTEELCKKYGCNYKKFAKWAQYESGRRENHFEKNMLNHIYEMFNLSLSLKGIDAIN